MKTLYLDSSAILKRSLAEAEAEYLEDHLAAAGPDDELVSSLLGVIETRRVLRRAVPADELEAAVANALKGITVVPISEAIAQVAGDVGEPWLRSLDAIHLATALAVAADEVVTYDDRLADAARTLGLVPVAPGRS